MIDLSNAKVDDEYLCDHNFESGVEMRVAYISKGAEVLVLESDTHGGMVVDFNGKGIKSNRQGVISKIDNRPWLKDMPDAGIFADNVHSLHMSESGCWFYNRKGVGYHYDLCGALKMPTLTGDQWKDSKISIKDLREWQLNNK